MLRKPFEGVVTNDAGEVTGVKSEGETAKCKFVVADPSYFPDKVTQAGEIVRCICFLKTSPIKNVGSAQIIVPAKQCGRQTDMYISYVSSTHNVVPEGMFLAIVNAKVETADPKAELDAGLDVLGGQANIWTNSTRRHRFSPQRRTERRTKSSSRRRMTRRPTLKPRASILWMFTRGLLARTSTSTWIWTS